MKSNRSKTLTSCEVKCSWTDWMFPSDGTRRTVCIWSGFRCVSADWSGLIAASGVIWWSDSSSLSSIFTWLILHLSVCSTCSELISPHILITNSHLNYTHRHCVDLRPDKETKRKWNRMKNELQSDSVASSIQSFLWIHYYSLNLPPSSSETVSPSCRPHRQDIRFYQLHH